MTRTAAPRKTATTRRAPRARPAPEVEPDDDTVDMVDGAEPDAEFHTDDTAIEERPTAEITVGATVFRSRAPKTKAYEDMAAFVVVLAEGDDAKVRLDNLNGASQLSPKDQRELEAALAAVPRYIEIRDQMSRFLAACLPKDERERLWAAWDDPDADDIDSEHLIQAALDLFVTFQPYFEKRLGNIGFQMPEADVPAANRAVRRAAGRRTPTRRR